MRAILIGHIVSHRVMTRVGIACPFVIEESKAAAANLENAVKDDYGVEIS